MTTSLVRKPVERHIAKLRLLRVEAGPLSGRLVLHGLLVVQPHVAGAVVLAARRALCQHHLTG